MKEEFVEELLISTLRFWIKKIKRGDCTLEQEKAILDAITKESEVYGTIEEIADFYGKSKEDVYGVIKRKFVGKPKRNIVMYPFNKFAEAAPKSWSKKSDKSET